jgi:hypothetical protein
VLIYTGIRDASIGQPLREALIRTGDKAARRLRLDRHPALRKLLAASGADVFQPDGI